MLEPCFWMAAMELGRLATRELRNEMPINVGSRGLEHSLKMTKAPLHRTNIFNHVQRIFCPGVDGQLPCSLRLFAPFFIFQTVMKEYERTRSASPIAVATSSLAMSIRCIFETGSHIIFCCIFGYALGWPNVSVCYFENDITCCARHALLPPLPLHFCAAISFPVAPK